MVRDQPFVAGRGNGHFIKAFPVHVRVSAAQALEVTMTTVKGLAIIALLVGGTSLAIAQSGPPTGGLPPVAGGAGGNPAAPGPPGPGVIPHDARAGANLQSAAPTTRASSRTRIAHQQTTKPQKKMFMSAKGTHHKALKDNSRLQTMPKQ